MAATTGAIQIEGGRMNETKLLPCLCGGKAEFHRNLSVIGDIVTVRCKACQTRTAGILFDAMKHPNDEEYDEAAALWNNRKLVEDVLERMEKKIQPLHNVNWNAAMEEAIEIIKEELM